MGFGRWKGARGHLPTALAIPFWQTGSYRCASFPAAVSSVWSPPPAAAVEALPAPWVTATTVYLELRLPVIKSRCSPSPPAEDEGADRSGLLCSVPPAQLHAATQSVHGRPLWFLQEQVTTELLHFCLDYGRTIDKGDKLCGPQQGL